MKTSPRYIRRRPRSTSRDANFFQKDNTGEQSFFGETVHESFFQQSPAALQRKCADCEEEDKSVKRKSQDKEEEKKLQRRGLEEEKEEKKLQRMPEKKEEEKLQKKSVPEKEEEKKLHKKETTAQAYNAVQTSPYLNTLNAKGSVLPNSALKFFGQKMGADFSNVKIHTGAEAESSAKEVNAKAYTYQNHIVFNENEYNPSTYDGKKLLAHELAHTLQQDGADLSKKDKDENSTECTAGSVDLEAFTSAGFNKKAGTVTNEKTKKSTACPTCPDECVTITGSLLVPFIVDTQIKLPPVPANLSPCQQERVRAAINGPLLAHEKEHVKAFETFNGTAALKINFQGCESDYSTHQETLAEQEFQRRKSLAEAKSDALDPFSVPVDLCCVDKAK